MSCKKDGCINTPISRGKYCNEHRTCKKICEIQDCTKGNVGKSDYCIKHGGGKRCQVQDCTTACPGKSNYCIKHGGGKRCQVQDCNTGATKKSNYCIKHGGGKRCQVQDCNNGAEKTTNYCVMHGGGKRCQKDGCNYCTRGISNYCGTHGGGNRCKYSECTLGAISKSNYCIVHGGGKRCKEYECKSSAIGKTDYCIQHGGGKRCKEYECKSSAIGKTDYCAKHKGGERCPNCIDWIDSRLANSKYDGYCITCFKHLFPKDSRSIVIHEHTKELRIRNSINEHFEGFIHDHPLYTGNCDCSHRRRIDHRKLIGNTILAIETDEFAHKYYNKKDEEIRYDDLYMIHSGKWIYIRFNPDKTKEHKIDMEDRITLLINVIDEQIERIKNEENTELIEIIKLFY
jgi:hypothetical protein